MKTKATLTEVRYIHNQVFRSLLGLYYFVSKAKKLPGGAFEVVGQKHDVTDSVLALIQSDRAEQKAKARKAKKKPSPKRSGKGG